MSLRPEHIVNLKGRDYPIWAGVLDLAHAAGLTSLTVTVLQVPSPENGHEAIVRARAEFADGRVFEDIGDASPKNTSAQLAPAVLRLASTRAKGRVLRDAVNIGETLADEIGPDVEERPQTRSSSSAPYHVNPTRPPSAPTPAPLQAPRHPQMVDAPLEDPFDKIPAMHVPTSPGVETCAECGKALTKNDLTASAANAKYLEGKALCMTHIAANRQKNLIV